ncbi:TetR/AcrR family transcriptional regulator [Erysipelothrix urinaevulpis]|uniref:TetR/AcrR family transcriptional regulator n=1 Tax=Erysipelothrix urinaevulpis TaxID=2683717 RepID=UPI00135AC8ED|nr:TetR/AcrR family transcriptional regulator [Erysipelothrix urinaevulpis]
MNKHTIWSKTIMILFKTNQSFYSLSVETLCKEIGIHRSTFYRYFNSKYDLLQFGVNLLWTDYFHSFNKEILLKPFTSSNDFYQYSNAKKLIQSQRNYPEVLQDIQNLTLSKLEDYYKSALNDANNLHAGFIIATINYLDEWNHKAQKPLTELDIIFNALCASSLHKIKKLSQT